MSLSSRRVRAASVWGLVAALALSLVPATAAHAAGPGSVTVTLTDAGAPVAGASVTLFGPDFAFGSADVDGVVVVSDLALGDYTLNASAPDGRQTTTAIALTAAEPGWTGTLAFEPWPTGTSVISGTVTDVATGAPIGGAAITIGGVVFRQATSDSVGAFSVTDLPAGEYSVSASAPGYFDGYATVTVTEGSTASAPLALVAADARIEGRVVDGAGVGVGGVVVLATGSGSLFTTSGPDGSFALEGAGAGTWEVATFADADWERSVATVEVSAGSTAVAPDLVLVPRFTGTITGTVASSDGLPEGERGGFFDVCVTVLTPDGDPVAGASTVTGGDSFYGFFLAPGDYTVYFEDCDPDRAPHRYQSAYLGDSPTLAGATIVTVETLVDLPLPTTTLVPEVGDAEPDHPASAAPRRELKRVLRDLVDAPAQVRRTETFAIDVGTERAGEWVSVWVYSAPQQLGGWHQVAADGTVTVTMPAGAALHRHRLSVQDADDHVVGWTWVAVQKAPRP